MSGCASFKLSKTTSSSRAESKFCGGASLPFLRSRNADSGGMPGPRPQHDTLAFFGFRNYAGGHNIIML
jgi:hypothetical protein